MNLTELRARLQKGFIKPEKEAGAPKAPADIDGKFNKLIPIIRINSHYQSFPPDCSIMITIPGRAWITPAQNAILKDWNLSALLSAGDYKKPYANILIKQVNWGKEYIEIELVMDVHPQECWSELERCLADAGIDTTKLHEAISQTLTREIGGVK